MEDIKNFIKGEAKKNNINLSENQIKLFYLYMNNLIEWNEKINLTAIKEEKDIVVKHFIDSIVIKDEIVGSKMLDLGSGAGFPGIPLKIINNKLEVTLLDAVNKKVNFMNDTIEKLSLKDIIAIHSRAEDLAHDEKYREKYDIVVSRAVSNMTTLVEYMVPFLKKGGKCICLKGPDVDKELEEAKNAIRLLGGKIEKKIQYELNGNGRSLIVILKEKHTEQIYPRKQGKPIKEPLK